MSEENAVVSSAEVVETPIAAPEVSQETQETPKKVFYQEDVNEVVQKRLGEAKSKYEQAGYERAQAELAAKNMATQPQHQHSQTTQSADNANLSEEEQNKFRSFIAKESENQRIQGVIDHGLNTFRTRVQEGFTDPAYPDYKEVVEVLNTEAMTPVALLSSTFENTKDIIYHLGKDSAAAGTILNLMQNPATVPNAQRMLADISRQLAQNKAAKSAPAANPPLSQISASTTGVDSGSLTHEERRLKSAYRR